MEGSGGSAGRLAAWLLKQGSGASASGPCWFCGVFSDLLCRANAVAARISATGILQPAVQAAISGLPRSLRLAVQDAALSRQKQGFESPRECHISMGWMAIEILKLIFPDFS